MTGQVFRNVTNWIIITGAPSSGKTSVIDALARRGHEVHIEVARAWIQSCLDAGLTMDDIRRDNQALQRKILSLKIDSERQLDTAAQIFMDRGMVDSMAYFRQAGIDPAEAASMSCEFRYSAVFMLDRLPLVHDAVRTEDEAVVAALGEMVERDYAAMGYDVIRVPVMPIEDRADFVLKYLHSMQREQVAA